MTPSTQLHPLSRRIMHWLNALAIIVMIGSGWRIERAPSRRLYRRFPGERGCVCFDYAPRVSLWLTGHAP